MADDAAWVPGKDTREMLFKDIENRLFFDKSNPRENWRYVINLSSVLLAELALRMKVDFPEDLLPYSLDHAYVQDVVLRRIKILAPTPETSIELVIDLQTWLLKKMGERVLLVETQPDLQELTSIAGRWPSDYDNV